MTERTTGDSPTKPVAIAAASQVRGAERLDTQARLILRLRFQGLSESEIAERADCSVKQVSRIIGRSVSYLLDTKADGKTSG